jgi:hypothetical protein
MNPNIIARRFVLSQTSCINQPVTCERCTSFFGATWNYFGVETVGCRRVAGVVDIKLGSELRNFSGFALKRARREPILMIYVEAWAGQRRTASMKILLDSTLIGSRVARDDY